MTKYKLAVNRTIGPKNREDASIFGSSGKGHVYGSRRIAQWFQDAVEGKDSLDLAFIGDSNVTYTGRGYTEGFAIALLNAGAVGYASPLFDPVNSPNGPRVGYGTRAFGTIISTNVGSSTSGAVPTLLRQTFTNFTESSGASSNAALPYLSNMESSGNYFSRATLTGANGSTSSSAGARGLQFAWANNNANAGYTGVWLYEKDSSSAHSENENGCVLDLKSALRLRVLAHLPEGDTSAFYTRFRTVTNGSTVAIGSAIRHESPRTNEGEWAVFTHDLSADPTRTGNGVTYRLEANINQGGGNSQIAGVSGYGIAFQSVCRPNTKGIATNTFFAEGGTTLTQFERLFRETINGNTTNSNQKSDIVQLYLKELRERQQSCGGTGRVVICIEGGVNLEVSQQSPTPTQQIEAIVTLQNTLRNEWILSGGDPSLLGFLFFTSHQPNYDTASASGPSNTGNVYAIRSAAKQLMDSQNTLFADTTRLTTLGGVTPSAITLGMMATHGFDKAEGGACSHLFEYQNPNGYEAISAVILNGILAHARWDYEVKWVESQLEKGSSVTIEMSCDKLDARETGGWDTLGEDNANLYVLGRARPNGPWAVVEKFNVTETAGISPSTTTVTCGNIHELRLFNPSNYRFFRNVTAYATPH